MHLATYQPPEKIYVWVDKEEQKRLAYVAVAVVATVDLEPRCNGRFMVELTNTPASIALLKFLGARRLNMRPGYNE